MKNALIVAAVFALCSTTAAFAHARLDQETPAADSTVAVEPTLLTLKFSEAVSPKFSGLKLTSSSKAEIAVGVPTVDPKDDALLLVPIVGPLASGKYDVTWHALSSDGHKTTGSFAFTVK